MDTNRPCTLRRISGAGLALGVVSAALVALPTTALAATAPAFGTTWVTSQSGNSVTQLSPTGAVVGSPIKGASTGLADPQGVVADTAGHVFVANLGGNSITEYATGASGNVAPMATISGAQTGLSGPTGLALLGSELWVSDSTTNTLEEFSAGADGNVLPIETISGSKTALDNPAGLYLTPQGLTLWVVNDPVGRPASVAAFDTTRSGNQAPQRIAGAKTQLSDPTAVTVDEQHHVYVANSHSNAITTYQGGFGDVKPTSVLSGSATDLDGPTALHFDALGRLSVANAGDGALRVFGNGAHGDVAPTRSVTGVTGLADPGGVTVSAAIPSVPRSLSATAKNHAVRLSWTAPSSTGGGVLGYLVVSLKHKPGTIFQFPSTGPFTTSSTHFTSKHLKNGHRYYFAIFAVNAIGNSGFTSFVHATPATVPGAPRAVKLAPHTDALTVTWKAPKSDGGRTIRHYTVQFATCTIGAKGCHAPSLTVKGTHRSLTLKGLSAGTPYHVVVAAKNSRGVGKPSKPVTGTPAA
jgi:hypothetical protein